MVTRGALTKSMDMRTWINTMDIGMTLDMGMCEWVGTHTGGGL